MATKPKSGPQEKELVPVFDTQEESEAMIVRGLLESAGIESIITGLDAPQDILPGVGGVLVQVPAEKADDARQIIEDYRTAGDAEAGELSSEESETSREE
jgi:putative signal transducing protein